MINRRNIRDFSKNSRLAFWTCTLSALVIYLPKIVNQNIGIDSASDLVGGDDQFLRLGRWGLYLIQKLLLADHLNPLFTSASAVFFLVLGAMLWVMALEEAKDGVGWNALREDLSDTSGNRRFGDQLRYAGFTVFYVSSPVWAENIYFSHQSFAVLFGAALCPVEVMLIFRKFGCVPRKIRISSLFSREAFGTVLLGTFICSIYQPLFFLLCAGMVGIYLIRARQEENKYESSNYPLSFFTYAAAVLLFSGFVYLLISIILKRIILRIPGNSYLSGMLVPWNRTKLLMVFSYLYKLFLDDISVLHRFTDPLIQSAGGYGIYSVENFHGTACICCVLYLPAFIVYIRRVFGFHGAAKWMYRLVGLALPVLVLVPALAGSGDPMIRVQMALAFGGAFLLWLVSNGKTKRMRIIWTGLLLLAAWFQVQKSASLIASDQIRYEKDAALTRDIANDIAQLGNSDEKQVLLLGAYHPEHNTGYREGELLGKSCFFYDALGNKTGATRQGLIFMKALGYSFQGIGEEDEKLGFLKEQSERMPSYPENGYVQEEGNYIIVKLSDEN